MTNPSSKAKIKAFTLIELIVVIAIIGVLAAVLLPVPDDHRRNAATTAYCMNNLRMIGSALSTWAQDHSGHYPPQVSRTNGGTMESIGQGGSAVHFIAISNELARTYGQLFCPTDKTKTRATNDNSLTDRNVSYFLNVDAAPGLTNTFLAGDRHLQADGKPVPAGLFTLNTNILLDWTTELHNRSSKPFGVVQFVDGHAERIQRNLQALAQRQALPVNRLAVP